MRLISLLLLPTLLASSAVLGASVPHATRGQPDDGGHVPLPTRDALFTVPPSNFTSSLQCTSTPNGKKKVVLLVHGTALNAKSWQSGPYWHLLPSHGPGYDVCTVNLPYNALADAQVNGEYVAHAILTLAAKSKGGKIGVVTHSQGGLNAQWALTFWPSTRAKVSSFIGLAPDFHGTNLLPGPACLLETVLSLGQGCSAAFLQQQAGSNYLNAQESFYGTKGALVPTTAVFTRTDEIVIPQFPDEIASSRLDGSQQFPLQNADVCGLLHLADHLEMQIDPAAYGIVLQSLASSKGHITTAQFDRTACYHFANTDLNFDDAIPTLDYLTGLGTSVLFSGGVYSKGEPPLKKYVCQAGAATKCDGS